jgi:hypothetical protein
MNIKLNQTATFDFTTHDPYTGQVSDADVLPVCDIFEDATDVSMLSPLVVKRVGHLGNYRVSFDATAANGFELDKSYNMIATAIVSGVTAKSRIAEFSIPSTVTSSVPGVSI